MPQNPLSVTAFAPASVANVFVGFDILGFSLSSLGDTIILRKGEEGVSINEINGITEVPKEARLNTAGYALLELIRREKLNFGFEISINKGIPLASGLGGSAASAVAAVVAANKFLENPLTNRELLYYALLGESVASGTRHGDNITASLIGGLTAFIHRETADKYDMIELPIPHGLHAVVVHPNIQLKTKDARNVLKRSVNLDAFTRQNMAFLQFLHGCYENDLDALRNGASDFIIEPQRTLMIPYFDEIKSRALDAGVLGWTISGAGPTSFGFAKSLDDAMIIEQTLREYTETLEIDINVWSEPLLKEGAKVIEVT